MSRRKTSSFASGHRRLSSRKKLTAVSWSVSSTEAKSLSRPGDRDAMEDFGGSAFGSQNSGWADAKPPKSSIASRYPGRPKDLASVEETPPETAGKLFPLVRPRG